MALFLCGLAHLTGCGPTTGRGPDTVAELEVVRPSVHVGGSAVGGVTRVAAGAEIAVAVGGRAQLAHDLAARLLLDGGARITVAGDGVRLDEGRVWVEAGEGIRARLTVPSVTIEAAGAAFSAERHGEALQLTVARGAISFRAGERRGEVKSGESALLDGAHGKVEVHPEALWDDWTGGLAWPDPGHGGGRARSLGEIGARRPGSLGEARFPLAITRLEVRTRIEDDLAITRVVETFFNPASETLEGLYRVRVPEGALLQRFAIDRDGRWADGFVKERQAARAQYQAQVYAGSTKDPALLEWDTRGSFRARIYPIPAGATRRVLLEYSEWLTPHGDGGRERSFRFPMAGGADSPVIQELDVVVDATRSGATGLRAGLGARIDEKQVILTATDFRPRADLVVDLVAEARVEATARGYRSRHATLLHALPTAAREDDYYLALPVVLPLAPTAVRAPLDLALVVDISAGTDATHLQLARSVIEALLAHLDAGDRVAVVGADLELHPLPLASGVAARPALQGAARASLDKMLDALARQGTGGASDLGATLTQAAGLLDPTRRSAVVYVGDAFPTVGELDVKALRERLDRLPTALRLYGIGIGDDADLALLEGLANDGGLALRVGDRAGAAAAALRVLGHAARRAAFRVTVDLGAGVDRIYPRRPTAVVEGEALPIVARVRDEMPKEVTISGLLDGKPFTVKRQLGNRVIEGHDLRLRWAQARLDQLLADGATAEEVAELGTRQNLITPFTSFYVPSADELTRRMPRPGVAPRSSALARLGPLLAPGLALGLGAFGCSREARAPATVAESTESLSDPGAQVEESAPSGGSRHRGEEGKMGRASSPSQPGRYAPRGPTADSPSPVTVPAAPPPPAARAMAGEAKPDDQAEKKEEAEPVAADEGDNETAPSESRTRMADSQGMLRGVGAKGDPAKIVSALAGIAGGDFGAGHGYGDGSGGGAEEPAKKNKDKSSSLRPEPEAARLRKASGRLFAAADDRTIVQINIGINVHRPRHCSPGSQLELADRATLWRERLSQHRGVEGAMEVWQDARSTCELKMWSDRRELLRAMLSQLGAATAMVQLYHRFDDEPAEQDFLRRALLGAVKSAADLRVVYDGLGLSEEVRSTLADEVVARAKSPQERVLALEQLLVKWPEDVRLKLKMIEALEAVKRVGDARRLADEVRRSPSPDAQARTLIGEFLARQGDLAAARRAFSEIVEFAPRDPLARRRLGDLYRAHGWFDEAYRQYQTLAVLSPGDLAVLLLQAAAAAGAGRIDEALRLEQRVAETTEPGAESGLARVALWWSSVRQALLREAARTRNDPAELAKLLGRARRTGVLREARPFRALLTWAHPEADCELALELPGAPLAPATDVAPEFGIASVFSLEPLTSARIVVRRTAAASALRYEAQLILIWNEGEKSEHVQVVPLSFAPGVTSFDFHVDANQAVQ